VSINVVDNASCCNIFLAVCILFLLQCWIALLCDPSVGWTSNFKENELAIFGAGWNSQWLEPFLQVSTAESGYVVRTPQVPDSMKFHGCGKSNF
jgi:hypothetical protein